MACLVVWLARQVQTKYIIKITEALFVGQASSYQYYFEHTMGDKADKFQSFGVYCDTGGRSNWEQFVHLPEGYT